VKDPCGNGSVSRGAGGRAGAGALLATGLASAKGPKYAVVPQRERLAARQHEHASTITS
jgi:hypothetical protein